jgi:pimeloyl-ACP methyl ester carboxylesterase
MKTLQILFPLLGLALTGCGNFRNLAKDLKMLDEGYQVRGTIENVADFKGPVRASVVEWNRQTNQVYSGDQIDLVAGGTFVFSVTSPQNQYLGAFADSNDNHRLDPGEASWVYSSEAGGAAPLPFTGGKRKFVVRGRLSQNGDPLPGLRQAVDRALAGRSVGQFITRRGVRFSIGEIADLNEPRFQATRGEEGLWTPATLAITHGFGIYFREAYDPDRIPVLFIHGAGGSPQDWRMAMEKLDRKRYQPWFYFYPSGMRLNDAASALNAGVEDLHSRYGFQRLDMVAHSMGGLVARKFVLKNAIENQNPYIKTFITFSTPWDGHEAAAMGVKWAPSVVPSWHDMMQGSPFLNHLFDHKLKGRVAYHLLYSHRAKYSPIMPKENDGSISVASERRPEALAEANSEQGYDEDHVSILTSRAALKRAREILDSTR